MTALSYWPLALAIVCANAGIFVLWSCWNKDGRRDWLRVSIGWVLLVSSFVALSHYISSERTAAYGPLMISLIAYAAVVSSIELRGRTARASGALAPEPEQRRTNWPRAIAKSLLAIVLAGIAAIGIGVAFAVAMPLGTHDRIVIGGILVPLLWGGGMAWTLADAKLLRATIILLSISATAYAIAFLPKVLGS